MNAAQSMLVNWADSTGRRNTGFTWLRGDIVGRLCARAVAADVVVTPVSSNTVLELSGAVPKVVRTRIGSPYVIRAMMDAAKADASARVCGYEANGGYLLGSAVDDLAPLPTRDALLPLIAVVMNARERPLAEVVAELPPRCSSSSATARKTSSLPASPACSARLPASPPASTRRMATA